MNFNTTPRTDAQLINTMFWSVTRNGYIKTGEAVNVALQFFKDTDNNLSYEQGVRCWNYVLRQQ